MPVIIAGVDGALVGWLLGALYGAAVGGSRGTLPSSIAASLLVAVNGALIGAAIGAGCYWAKALRWRMAWSIGLGISGGWVISMLLAQFDGLVLGAIHGLVGAAIGAGVGGIWAGSGGQLWAARGRLQPILYHAVVGTLAGGIISSVFAPGNPADLVWGLAGGLLVGIDAGVVLAEFGK